MSSDSLLSVNLRHRVGALLVDVDFCLTAPWTVLFGPSGSGKTTLLRAIAGFVRPDAGRIAYRETVLVDDAAGVFLPAHARPVRSAAQSARLFPHMTVMANVLYGCGWYQQREQEREVAEQVMAVFQVEGLAKRMPSDLSGGERQRVATARAVLAATTAGPPGSALLLLDEPFAGLDTGLRDAILPELWGWVRERGIPVVSVTHDVAEAFQLLPDVLKIAEGRVVLQGEVCVVLAKERERLLGRLNA
jgi:molybdate transport system ATP-binding protein